MRKIASLLLAGIITTSGMLGLFTTQSGKVKAATTFYVGGMGPGNYSTIQGAINNASDEDIVFVYSGTYYENIVIDKTISLIGFARDTTTIHGKDDRDVIKVTANNVSITKLRIMNDRYQDMDILISEQERIFGINAQGDNLNLIHNDISGHDSAIFLNSSCGHTIDGNSITKNNWRGLRISSSNNNTISGNIISKNDMFGVSLYSSSNNRIYNNNISNNSRGISIYATRNTVINDNTISDNSDGISLDYSSNITIEDNIFYNDSISLEGNNLAYWNSHSIKNNTVDGIPLYYYSNTNGITVISDAATMILANCTDFVIENNSVDRGIYLGYSSNCTIKESIISGFGVSFFNSSHNSLIENNISGIDISGNGISLRSSGNNTINDNMVSGKSYGISLDSSNRNTIIGNNITNNNICGIRLTLSTDNTIESNNISLNGHYAIWLSSSHDNTIKSNNIYENGWKGISLSYSINTILESNTFINDNIIITGDRIEHWINHIIENNTANGRPIYYYRNAVGITIPSNAVAVILANCTGFIIDKINASNIDDGIQLGFSSNCTIKNSIISRNRWNGIHLYSSSGNTIRSNDISFNYEGVSLVSSHFNDIIDNNISHNGGADGISLASSTNNTINGNNIIGNNGDGVWLYSYSNNNTINGNNISKSFQYGIVIRESSNNTIFHNNLIDNAYQAEDRTRANMWNLSYPYGGNYWSDYKGRDKHSGPKQDKWDSDGIGDTPHSGRYFTDYYPFLGPINITKSASFEPHVPLAPNLLHADAGDGYVNLTWEASSENGGFEISSYRIYRSTNSGDISFFATTINTYFNDSNVSNDQTYYYKISAVNRIGIGLLSSMVNATPFNATEDGNDEDIPNGTTLNGKADNFMNSWVLASIIGFAFIIFVALALWMRKKKPGSISMVDNSGEEDDIKNEE